jgi:organic radical activating enzyme
MNKQWNLHFKITNWCDLNCKHCCECSAPTQPLKLFPLEKVEKYMSETASMNTKPNELISIGGGEVMAPYIHNQENYIPNVLDIVYKNGFVPTLKTNGVWGNNDRMRIKILYDIAKCAYKHEKLVTLDISVDEFHNNQSGVVKIISDITTEIALAYAIRICLVGFNTQKSLVVLNNLEQELSKKGFYVIPNEIGDWVIISPDGKNMMFIYNDFTSSIFNKGRAKINNVYTNSGQPNNDGYNCLVLDNNDMAIYNYKYREQIKNRSLYEIINSFQQTIK